MRSEEETILQTNHSSYTILSYVPQVNFTSWTPRPVETKQPTSVTMDVWCDRMGGSTENALQKLVKLDKLGNMQTKNLSESKRILQQLSNQKHSPHSGQMPRCSQIGYKLYGDEQGPHAKSFIHHFQYTFGWLDDRTNFGVVHFCKRKSDAILSFNKLKAWWPHQIRVIITDGAKEYFSEHMSEIAENADIYWNSSPAYTPQRNARVEHWWYRTDCLTRYMLARCGATKIFWAYAKAYAVLITNIRLYGPTKQIPYEEFMNQKFNYGKLRVFGCTVCIKHLNMKGQYQKYNNKSELGFYLGFDMFSWKHLCYGLDTKRVHEGPTFTSMEQNFGALHLFIHRNPALQITPSQELLDFKSEVESQGENFDETKLQTNPFGISTKSNELWKSTAQNHDINISLPEISQFDKPFDKSTEKQNEEQTLPGKPPSSNEDLPIPMPILQTLPMQNENSFPEADPIIPEADPIIPEADPMEVQENIISGGAPPQPNKPNVQTRQTSKIIGDKPTFNPTIPTSTATKEVQNLTKQNETLSGLSNVAESYLLCMTENTSTTENSMDMEKRWMLNCEHAMHLFMVQGMTDGGFWTEYPMMKQSRKRKFTHPILGTAMPTMDGPEPQSIEQAKQWENSEKYLEATEKEMGGHRVQGTYVPCEKPMDAEAIDTRLVYVRKINPDNSILYKARWVARGFTQVAGENFDWDTVFAPVLRMTSLRWIFSLVAEYGLDITSADVVQAFLQSDLKESEELKDIYVKLPKGYEVICPKTGKVLKYGRLIKALYGLKQSPRRWAEKLTNVMTKIGFKQHPQDPCVYFIKQGDNFAIYGIYVDDMIKVTNSPALRARIDAILSKELKITHTGECIEFLGLELKWKTSSTTGKKYLNVCQDKYITKILTRFGMNEANPVNTPCKATDQDQSKVYLWPNTEPPENVDQELLSRYRAGVGALIYLSVMTRPDISYSVSAVAQFMSNPNSDHEIALWRIFRYLRFSHHYSLKYFHTGHGMTMTTYVDANFMGDYDSRSVTGKLLFSGNGLIEWGSNRQSVIATSTSHSECIAFFEAVKSVIYVRKLIEGFVTENRVLWRPTIVYCDNSATVELTRKLNENPDRTKHWNMQWNWLHEQRDSFHQFTPIHKKGTLNWADIGTKPLTKDLHNRIVQALHLDDC